MNGTCIKNSLIVAALGITASAAAVPVTYDNQSSWAQAVQEITTIDFNTGSDQAYRGSSYLQSGVTFTANGSVHSIYDINYDASYHASGYLDLQGSELGMDFGNQITAVSFEFGDFYNDSVYLDITLSNGETFNAFSPYSGYGFFGITSDIGFDSLTMTTTNLYTAFDNVAFSTSMVAAVPEPGSLALLGIGVAGIGFARVKRRC